MCEVIQQSTPRARKAYDCMACEWIVNEDVDEALARMTSAEKQAFRKARRNGFKIQPGQKYIRAVMKEDGMYTFRAIPAIHKICLRLDLYEC